MTDNIHLTLLISVTGRIYNQCKFEFRPRLKCGGWQTFQKGFFPIHKAMLLFLIVGSHSNRRTQEWGCPGCLCVVLEQGATFAEKSG